MTRESKNPKGGIRHRFSGALYASDGPNRVRVTAADGAVGIFDGIGRWLEGVVFEADPEMCVWMSTNRIEASHRLSPQATKAKGSA